MAVACFEMWLWSYIYSGVIRHFYGLQCLWQRNWFRGPLSSFCSLTLIRPCLSLAYVAGRVNCRARDVFIVPLYALRHICVGFTQPFPLQRINNPQSAVKYIKVFEASAHKSARMANETNINLGSDLGCFRIFEFALPKKKKEIVELMELESWWNEPKKRAVGGSDRGRIMFSPQNETFQSSVQSTKCAKTVVRLFGLLLASKFFFYKNDRIPVKPNDQLQSSVPYNLSYFSCYIRV